MENGYNIYTSQGVELHSQQLEKFFQFVWRPRPPTPLDEPRLKDIRKNLREIGKKLDAELIKRRTAMDSVLFGQRRGGLGFLSNFLGVTRVARRGVDGCRGSSGGKWGLLWCR